MMCYLIGTLVQFSISELLILVHQSDGIGVLLHLFLKQCMNAASLRVGGLCLVPLYNLLVEFAPAQKWERDEALFDVAHHALKDELEMSEHALDGRWFKEVEIIFENSI